MRLKQLARAEAEVAARSALFAAAGYFGWLFMSGGAFEAAALAWTAAGVFVLGNLVFGAVMLHSPHLLTQAGMLEDQIGGGGG
jgi:hypothetical protein